MLGTTEARGVRIVSPILTVTAIAAANAQTLFQVSAFAGMVGTKSYIIKRIRGHNAAGANSNLLIGTGVGAAFVQQTPTLVTLNGMDFTYGEWQLPQVELFVDLTVYATVAGVDVQVEVEEIG